MQPDESKIADHNSSPEAGAAVNRAKLPPSPNSSTPAVTTQGPSQKLAKPLALALIAIGLLLLVGAIMALLNLNE